MLSVAEALNKLLEAVIPVDTINIKTKNALGYVLASPLYANIDLPAFTNSSMDGFAVRAEDTYLANSSKGVSLEIVGDIPAGKVSSRFIKKGETARIMTGASLPEGADSVIPVEFTNFVFAKSALNIPGKVEIYKPVKPGDFVRKRGDDVKKGSLVIDSRKRLRPQEIGFLALLGMDEIEVYRKPRIAVLSTGDELIPLGTDITAGKIFDANSYSLSALLFQNNSDVVSLGITGDSVDSVKEKLDYAVNSEVDLIITSAGVSVGAYDIVREVIDQWGRMDFWKINMRPGKPLAFGKYMGKNLVGLPGNPVSAFIGFEVIIKPAIRKMSGLRSFGQQCIKVKISESIESDGRESYLRSFVWYEKGHFLAKLVSHQGSGNLHSLVEANALLIVPSEVKSLPIDAELNAWFFNDQLNLDA